MSNVEARAAAPLSPPDDGPVRLRGPARRHTIASSGIGRRRLLVLWLLASDIVSGATAIIAAAMAVTAAWPIVQVGLGDWLEIQMAVTLPLLIGISALLGVYRSSTRSLMERFRIRATAMLLFVFAGIMMWAREGSSVELAIMPLVGSIALVVGSWAEHLTIARFARSGAWGAPTAILGIDAGSRTFARLLMSQPAWGLKPVGFIDDGVRDGSDGTASGQDEKGATLPLLGTLEDWRPGVDVEVVVVPDGHALPRDPEALYRLGAHKILVVNQLGEFASFGLQVRQFDRFVALELGERPRNPGYTRKRLIDLAVALPLALLTAPMVIFLALMIKVVDPGPALYRQQRVGRYGKPIQILKLRTMYRDAEQRLEHVLATDAAMREQWQRYFKLSADPRILPHIGDFLRRTSLDELPQLWNVIRGDMSVVGPRPFPAYHLNAFDPEFQALRATVMPGLTGLWQISSRSSGDLGVQRAQDCFYIRNRSFWLDLYILIATLPAVIGGQGAR